ncbi:hypothetical protein QOK74_07930 [Staphylococcus saprophyticus]|uniref:hypothetical protein n=1 Tax=Staphylococcus saprophyticus TaxID=29385 RepID=UPI0024C2878C|nr:hypothetical protein [Staphylococcus saprophyticus]MDK1672798.1 hypothetical protein [Staphylococcus saprophyticus]
MRIAILLVIIFIILAICLYVPIAELYKYLKHKDEIRQMKKTLVSDYQQNQINRIKLDTEISRLEQEIKYRKELMPKNEEIKKLEVELSKLNEVRGEI